jgi:hypothetical protein
MGSSSSSEFDYTAQLMADNKMVSKEKASAPEEKGATKPRIDIQLEGEELREFPKFADGKLRTLWDSFTTGAAAYPDNNMLGTRKYEVLVKFITPTRHLAPGFFGGICLSVPG